MFGKKIVCDECVEQFKEKNVVRARFQQFCSESCRDSWLSVHPAQMATGGTPESNTEAAVKGLQSARESLAVAIRAGDPAGAVVPDHLLSGLMTAGAAIQGLDQIKGEVEAMSEYFVAAVPFLNAIGREALSAELEELDQSARQVLGKSSLFAGSSQNKNIAKVLLPVLERLGVIVGELSGVE